MNSITIDLGALARYNITPNQYVFLFLIHSRQHTVIQKFGQVGPGFSVDEVENLVDRGLLLNLNKAGYFYTDFFALTDNLGNELFVKNREKAALEFWNAYPILLRDAVTGENHSLLNTNKQEFIRDYYIRVGYSEQKHRRVMEAVDYAIEADLIDMTIRQWLDSEQWKLVLELKESQKIV